MSDSGVCVGGVGSHNSIVCDSIDDVSLLVWGPTIRPELFARWSQGFIFSESENTALLQTNGGPCAVIAPVQAVLIKNIINKFQLPQIREVDRATVDQHLALTLTELLCQCVKQPLISGGVGVHTGTGVGHTGNKPSSPSSHTTTTTSSQTSTATSNDHGVGHTGNKPSSPSSHTTTTTSSQTSTTTTNDHGPFQLACLEDPLPPTPPNSNLSSDPDQPQSSAATQNSKDHALFHAAVRLRVFDSVHSLQNHLETHIHRYKAQYGVLLFLYSIILTKGVHVVRDEMGGGEVGESLIEVSEGHGSQGLINLLITGRASPYVWDGNKDVGGLCLVGVVGRPVVGFLSKLEHLRYVQVGWYLKNPTNPVWVMASETHLSVVFSFCDGLVTPENELERAKQVFGWYDTEGNRFIQTQYLKPILNTLNLCTDDDYVQFMLNELDPDEMGVILFNRFVEAFSNDKHSYSPPDTFILYHYNGLQSSCPNNKLEYAEGRVTLQESHVSYSSTQCDILQCINTKWPNADIHWHSFTPSLN